MSKKVEIKVKVVTSVPPVQDSYGMVKENGYSAEQTVKVTGDSLEEARTKIIGMLNLL